MSPSLIKNHYKLNTIIFFLFIVFGLTTPEQVRAQEKVPDINRVAELFQNGRFSEIKALTDSILQYDSGNQGAILWKANAQFASRNFQGAVNTFENPGLWTARLRFVNPRMGMALALSGNHDRAFQVFTQIVEAGLVTKNDLTSSPVFNPVRNDKRFQKLITLAESIENNDLKELGLDIHTIDHTFSLHPLWKDNYEYDLTSKVHVRRAKKSNGNDKNSPLLIWMNPSFNANSEKVQEVMLNQVFRIWEEALPDDWTIAMPMLYNLSKIDFENWGWQNGEGITVINEVISFLKENYEVDDRRIYLGGYGNAGSMIYYFAQSIPDEIAGFISFGGHPIDLDNLKLNNHVVNYKNSNFLALYSQNDTYSFSSYQAYRNIMEETASNVKWEVVEEGITLSSLRDEATSIVDWMNDHELNKLPKTIDWQVSSVFPSKRRVFWLYVDKLSDEKHPSIFDPLPLVEAPFINTSLLWSFAPLEKLNGSTIIRAYEKGALNRAGMMRGDTIHSIDGVDISTPGFFPNINFLYSQNRNKKVPVSYSRNGVKYETEINLIQDQYTCFYNSDEASRIRVEKVNNDIQVKLSGIETFSLIIDPSLFDTSKPINVFVNGVKVVQEYKYSNRDRVYFGDKNFENVGLIRITDTYSSTNQ